jgi:tRNA A37 threonylcarbamoyladenosine modification protein TsaB
VGLTCAKTLAFAAGAALTTARALEVVAHNAPAGEAVLEVAFDAARGQVFAARFASGGQMWSSARPVSIQKAEDWVADLDPSALVLGPALVKYRDLLPARCRVADEALWWPRADWVIRLGLEQFRSGVVAPYWSLEPLYLRPSAAEEKRASRPE